MNWGFAHVSMPSTESALLSGWKSGKCVPCATCRCCSWPSCTVNRTEVPLRSPSLGQRILYSLLQGSDCRWTHQYGARRNTSRLYFGCSTWDTHCHFLCLMKNS
ncbi:ring finger protein 24 (predicted), isoform CRA_a [Rattus norvegicus]|uniref:Ring finger protein 24 (Predicted), isoform CRA_a n=1 Tax=Rattus norvegicus TaxID=10116 RepID=A6HQD8_RAT|nr:ring finger protein 24 (predicted), isoform CRA_a [Rattus norvegicus]|eukprot:NP_001102061.1 RING finger protein 24 [Rattus norvegicus]